LERDLAAAAVIEEQQQAMAYEAWAEDEAELIEYSSGPSKLGPVAGLNPANKRAITPDRGVASPDTGLNIPTLRAAPRRIFTGVRTPRYRSRTTVFYYYNAPHRFYGGPKVGYGPAKPLPPFRTITP
jgi:hypothetical protein